MITESQNVTDYTNNNTIFTVWTFKQAADAGAAFKRLCALVVNLNHSVNVRFPTTRVSCVMGIGHDAWLRLALKQPLPKELETFTPIIGAKHTAVATPGDIHIHLRADHPSICYDMARDLSEVLTPVADCVVEVNGFRYWDSRSILGFVDGTENPHGPARDYFAKIGDEDAAYKGCSYLYVQKYLHNLAAWNNLPVHEQERVIGRSKTDDIEMPDGVKPSNSHSALANVGDNAKIVRDNMPFGHISTNDMGTYFIAYASSYNTIQKSLIRMFLGEPEGNYDRILDFSTAVTGTAFFVPTMDMLGDWAG